MEIVLYTTPENIYSMTEFNVCFDCTLCEAFIECCCLGDVNPCEDFHQVDVYPDMFV